MNVLNKIITYFRNDKCTTRNKLPTYLGKTLEERIDKLIYYKKLGVPIIRENNG